MPHVQARHGRLGVPDAVRAQGQHSGGARDLDERLTRVSPVTRSFCSHDFYEVILIDGWVVYGYI